MAASDNISEDVFLFQCVVMQASFSAPHQRGESNGTEVGIRRTLVTPMKSSNGPINAPNRVAQLFREGGFINRKMQRNHPSGCSASPSGNGPYVAPNPADPWRFEATLIM